MPKDRAISLFGATQRGHSLLEGGPDAAAGCSPWNGSGGHAGMCTPSVMPHRWCSQLARATQREIVACRDDFCESRSCEKKKSLRGNRRGKVPRIGAVGRPCHAVKISPSEGVLCRQIPIRSTVATVGKSARAHDAFRSRGPVVGR